MDYQFRLWRTTCWISVSFFPRNAQQKGEFWIFLLIWRRGVLPSLCFNFKVMFTLCMHVCRQMFIVQNNRTTQKPDSSPQRPSHLLLPCYSGGGALLEATSHRGGKSAGVTCPCGDISEEGEVTFLECLATNQTLTVKGGDKGGMNQSCWARTSSNKIRAVCKKYRWLGLEDKECFAQVLFG